MIFDLSNGTPFRGDQLADEIEQATGIIVDPIEGMSFYPADHQVEIISIEDDPGGAVQAVVTAHVADPAYFVEDQEKDQGKEAQDTMRQYAQGLHTLSPHDKAYAVLARAFAFNDGVAPAEILAIDTKAEAQAYVASKPEWVALDPTVKAWAADELNAIALVLQALLVFALD